MHKDSKKLDALMNEILRLTDVMYQAIRADSFEIFESALDERGLQLEAYDQLTKGHSKSEGQKAFVTKMNEFEQLLRTELKRFDQKMHDEYSDTKKQLRRLEEGQKKTQKYMGDYGQITNGSNFDRKK